jgi:heat shock factor-binding protein 1
MDKKLNDDPNTKELNQFVQNMLKQMQERFDDMSSNIIGRVDEMGNDKLSQVNELTILKNQLDKS